MESVRVRQYVGKDGLLHLAIPVGLMNRDVDVLVIYQPAQVLMTAETSSLAQLYGVCADDPIDIDKQGFSE